MVNIINFFNFWKLNFQLPKKTLYITIDFTYIIFGQTMFLSVLRDGTSILASTLLRMCILDDQENMLLTGQSKNIYIGQTNKQTLNSANKNKASLYQKLLLYLFF